MPGAAVHEQLDGDSAERPGGLRARPNKALATLPVTGWVVGGAISTLPMSLLMKRLGRRTGFTVGADRDDRRSTLFVRPRRAPGRASRLKGP